MVNLMASHFLPGDGRFQCPCKNTYILISFISAQILLSVADVTLQESENKKMINVRKE